MERALWCKKCLAVWKKKWQGSVYSLRICWPTREKSCYLWGQNLAREPNGTSPGGWTGRCCASLSIKCSMPFSKLPDGFINLSLPCGSRILIPKALTGFAVTTSWEIPLPFFATAKRESLWFSFATFPRSAGQGTAWAFQWPGYTKSSLIRTRLPSAGQIAAMPLARRKPFPATDSHTPSGLPFPRWPLYFSSGNDGFQALMMDWFPCTSNKTTLFFNLKGL